MRNNTPRKIISKKSPNVFLIEDRIKQWATEYKSMFSFKTSDQKEDRIKEMAKLLLEWAYTENPLNDSITAFRLLVEIKYETWKNLRSEFKFLADAEELAKEAIGQRLERAQRLGIQKETQATKLRIPRYSQELKENNEEDHKRFIEDQERLIKLRNNEDSKPKVIVVEIPSISIDNSEIGKEGTD